MRMHETRYNIFQSCKLPGVANAEYDINGKLQHFIKINANEYKYIFTNKITKRCK